ncbi:MAG: hypothetical protein R6X16_13990 [Anaerolineae bacterium]
MASKQNLGQRLRRLLTGEHPVAVDEEAQSRLIGRLGASDAEIRLQAAEALAGFPSDAAGRALADATRDRDVRVREAAARSIRAIAAQAQVPVTPVMDALQLEPADSPALFSLVAALRELGPGEAAERVIMEKKGWGIARASKAKIDEMVSLREKLVEFSADSQAMEVAFDELFSRLDDPDPDVRNDVKGSLASNRYSVRPLWAIYNELLDTEPRRAVLAGRAIGHRLNPRGVRRVPVGTTMTKLGLAIAFRTVACPYCGRDNHNVPVTQRGLDLACEGRRTPDGAACALPVLCDFCGNDFFVTFDEDLRAE